MSKAGKKLLAAAQEAVDCAKSLRPYARLTFNGHAYVPVAEIERLTAEVEGLRAALRCERESGACVMVHDPDRAPCNAENCRYVREAHQQKTVNSEEGK